MVWLAPVVLALGIWGSHSAQHQRRNSKASVIGKDWWWLLLLAWFPALCWIACQFVTQY